MSQPGYPEPAAPYGRHPQTGQPYSTKSRVIAALLQAPGLFGFLGFGRIYTGRTTLGVVQLIVGLLTVGVVAVIWAVIDIVLMLTGRVEDSQGRPLRDGM